VAAKQGSGTSDDETPDVTEPSGFLKGLGNFFQKPENLTLLGALIFFLGLLWVGSEVIEKSKTFKETISAFLADAFEPPATGEIKLWFIFATIVLGGLLFTSLLYAIATFLSTRATRARYIASSQNERLLISQSQAASSERDMLKGELSSVKEERDSLRSLTAGIQEERELARKRLTSLENKLAESLNETIQAVSKISRQMFPSSKGAKGKTICSARVSYHINKNFDAEVHRRYVIRAGEIPLHFWQNSFSASGDADPIATFTDLGFQLISRDPGKDVVYLPSENDGYNKAASIFFMPFIEQGHEREFEVVYRWPGLFRRLEKIGWEDFTFSFRSEGPMENFELEVFLEDGTGGHLNCKEIGVILPDKTLSAIKNDRGWHGWSYQGKNISPEMLEEEIVLRLGWSRS
jgi:hypothetical protein